MDATRTTAQTALLRTVTGTPTDIWNDSCAVDELEYAIVNGAVGATSNPSIVLEVLRKERQHWPDRVRRLHGEHPEWTEVDLTWQVVEEMAIRGARVLEPVFVREAGRKGRLSIQTNPANYPHTERMLDQGVHFAGLAPNIQVKFPATRAGIAAIEEATYLGVNINATVCFTLPQALAVGEAVERGLRRREADGGEVASMSPVCTLMIGRLDDWMKVIADRDDILLTPGYADWAGLAVFKKAYGLYRERGYRARLLAAAFRSHLHWSELIGGDIVMTMTHQWQVRFNGSSIEVRPRIDEPVAAPIVDQLYERIGDFRRAYDEDGLRLEEFDTFGATVRTLRAFIRSYHDLMAAIREVVLPDPDVR